MVVLDPDRHIPGLRDSKLLPAAARERLYEVILARSVAWAIELAEPSEIDEVNIHRASLRAMHRAVMSLIPLPSAVIVDGFKIPDLPLAQLAIIKGDRRCAAIRAGTGSGGRRMAPSLRHGRGCRLQRRPAGGR